MFNNCNSKTNGEYDFFVKIKDTIQRVFDVGSRSNSEFTEFDGEVHYFDPVALFMNDLERKPNKNKLSYFNVFGLGDENKDLYYYPKYQSFYDRVNSCKVSDDSNKIVLKIKKASEYIINKNIQTIDFLKIDTEGFELNVLKGFEDKLMNVNIIQFEYGGTFLDNNVRLRDILEYLEEKGFYKFSYLIKNGTSPLTDRNDHYQYCNIVCINKKTNFVPF
jgi:FkbM family methyltransferase